MKTNSDFKEEDIENFIYENAKDQSLINSPSSFTMDICNKIKNDIKDEFFLGEIKKQGFVDITILVSKLITKVNIKKNSEIEETIRQIINFQNDNFSILAQIRTH